MGLQSQLDWIHKQEMKNITELAEWRALETHQKAISTKQMRDWFAEDSSRFSRFSLQIGDILLDYSKNRISAETITLLCQLAETIDLKSKITALFDGQPINKTEKRPALHTALRDQSDRPILVNDQNIMPAIADTLEKMRYFSMQVQQGQWRGCTNKPITDIVNIGIGGSHLGPLLTTQALADFASGALRCHFISNIDAAHLAETLRKIDPETTLFIISSKSFTTIETMTNATTIKAWLQNKLGKNDIKNHFVAVTAAPHKAISFGIPNEQIFPVWDWVGGRYSIWSAMGLPLILFIGMDNFLEFLNGAYEMDQHFRQADFSQNMPVLLALLGVWYINFFGANNHAIIPYSHQLTYLRPYLQQADMESNGKSVSEQGTPVTYLTGPIVIGEQGCDGQHAYHQSLHQGKHMVPVDFILVRKNKHDMNHHQALLIASGLSQSQALMLGKSTQQIEKELIQEGCSKETASYLAQHKSTPGNRPSNTLFLKEITPHNLGALLALYEHKIFVQGVIWDINSFDQWGVELGKQLLPRILADVQHSNTDIIHDSSTQGLIEYYKNRETVFEK